MLQVARLAPTSLGDSRELVVRFLHRRLNPDGGFQNRVDASDLYYTVFGLEALAALREEPPAATAGFLQHHGDGEALDFVHTTCLARAWASVSRDGAPHELRPPIVDRIEAHRTADGGFATTVNAAHSSVYACFLAVGALEDLHAEDVGAEDILHSLEALRAADGGYANQPGAAEGSTPATAAAAVLQRHFDAAIDPLLTEWLLARHHKDGGFFAVPRAPLPDLLSTATALHALTSMHVPLDSIKEACLDFVDTLWTNEGGFCGSWADPVLDCEYTYYGLLALGHLSL
jgi:prenyltransferase beta subunit